MFQWQAMEGGALNSTHRVSWDLREFQLLTQRETFGPQNNFQSTFLRRKAPTT